MPTKLNVESFISILKKSGLVGADQLERALAAYFSTVDAGDDPRPLASYLISLGLLTTWQADKLLQGKHRGFFLGKYKLLSLLGKGGMSSVYLAEHMAMRRQCALKVLPTKRVADSSYLERFQREAQAVARLDHPNIVRAYDKDHQIDGDQEIHFLVMEFVEGTSILDLVDENGLNSFLDAAEYARQAAAGLQHAHDHGMVHRDIKPGNLLVDRQGVVKILDLGLARFFTVDEGDDALTIRHDERVLGTADYLSPEQAIDSHAVDSRADIYSLGCTLYFMLTGRPPFTEGTLAQRLLAHQVKIPPSVESRRPDVPPGLAAILRKMMEKRREDRFQTASSVEAALFQWIDQTADASWRRAHSQVYEPRLADSGSVKVAIPPTLPRTQNRVETPKSWNEEPTSDVLRTTDIISDPSADAAETAIHPMAMAPTKPEIDQVTDVPSTTPTSQPIPESTISNAAPVGRDVPETEDDSRPMTTPDSSLSFLAFKSLGEPKVVAASVRRKRRPLSLLVQGLAANWRSPAGLGAIGTTLVLVIAAGMYSAGLIGSFGSTSDKTGRFPPDKTYVTVGPKNCEYSSIRDALITVRERYQPREGKGETFVIRVQSGTYRERLRIDGHSQPWPDGIIVRGEANTIIEATDKEPVIRVANVSRFTIENLQIDALQNPAAVELAEELDELRLQQVTVRGFTEVGVDCRGTQGMSFGNTQVLLERLTLDPIGNQAIGIRLVESAEKEVSNVLIRQCRFLKPMRAGVFMDGKSFHGVEISQSIFDQVTDGIRINQRPLLRSIHILNNTFRNIACGIRFSFLANELSSDVAFRRNLFVNVSQAEAIVQEPFTDNQFRSMISKNPVGIENNWSDRNSLKPVQGEVLPLFENGGRRGVTEITFVSTDPADPKFLAPADKSPQKEVAGSYFKDRKWVGAIGGQ